ncbi:MAG: prepilin-type N-terminal cleavage/methylation domain-containing protein [Planctomycetes bacterium]|nr:prepilin-type N-terminal cleavage/methylation domain-containing protein [Planctomycetota bacterium]
MGRRRAGLTLVELLVAMSIFLVLGGALVMFLRIGMQTWRHGEIQREAFERSQAILDQIADDLASAFTDTSHGMSGVVEVTFLSDYDDRGKQRLLFVRSLAGEMRHRITREAGTLTGGIAEYDFHNDAIERDKGQLRAPGGLSEIAYLMDPRAGSELLWRGLRAPIGGEGTLFDRDNVYNLEPRPDDPLPVRHCRAFAEGVLHIEYNFWGGGTRTWELTAEDESALQSWDSTKGMLSDFPGYRAGSRHEPRDDVFPSRVQIVLSLRPAQALRFARLRRAIDGNEREIAVDTTMYYPDGAFQYILIDDEWLRFDSKSDNVFQIAEDGRGVRGTAPASHAAGATVLFGHTFSRVVRVPGARTSGWVGK